MIDRDLTPEEIEELLQSQCYAHLGFTDEAGAVHVLPITYVCDDEYIYSYSMMGSKIEAMRHHPQVCVQVQELNLPDSWQSVQVWGTFSEIDKGAWDVVHKLISDFWSRTDINNVIYTPLRDFEQRIGDGNLVYRIKREKVIGKHGKHTERRV